MAINNHASQLLLQELKNKSSKMFLKWFVIVLCLRCCCAVIYHLDDIEYQRMPPLFSLDEYVSCLVEEGSSYCMLQLHIYAEPGDKLMRMITEYSDHRAKHYNHSFIDRGVCVRKTCHKYITNSKTTEDLTHSLEACLNDSLRREYGLSARVSTLYYCDHYNEPRYIDVWDWAVFALICGLVIINMVGSLYDYFLSKKKSEKTAQSGHRFLISFSIMRNWKWLIDTESDDPKTQDIQFLHGARAISNAFIVLAHVILIFAAGFFFNTHDFEKSFELPLYLMNYNGLMIVQIFFFISGFLTVYKLRLEEETRTFTAWDIPKIIALRLSRLVPALAVTLALSSTWVRHAGSGPLWKMYVTGALVADCRTYWWHTLLFINNYMPDNKFCLIPTWHLAADMQVFVVCVTVYIVTGGWARRVVLGALLLLSAAASALHTVLQDLDVFILSPEFFRSLASSTYRYQHIPGHNNLPCFIIGMFSAVQLHDWQKASRHLVKNKWYSLMQYLSVAAIPLLMYSGRMFYEDGTRASLLTRAAYSSAIRLLIGLACSLAMPALFMRTPTVLKSVFEWRRWVVPSRLSYCVFLIHIVLIHILMGSKMQQNYFSGLNYLSTHLCILLISYLVSVPLFLMVEAPFTTYFKGFKKQSCLKSSYTDFKNHKSF